MIDKLNSSAAAVDLTNFPLHSISFFHNFCWSLLNKHGEALWQLLCGIFLTLDLAVILQWRPLRSLISNASQPLLQFITSPSNALAGSNKWHAPYRTPVRTGGDPRLISGSSCRHLTVCVNVGGNPRSPGVRGKANKGLCIKEKKNLNSWHIVWHVVAAAEGGGSLGRDKRKSTIASAEWVMVSSGKTSGCYGAAGSVMEVSVNLMNRMQQFRLWRVYIYIFFCIIKFH